MQLNSIVLHLRLTINFECAICYSISSFLINNSLEKYYDNNFFLVLINGSRICRNIYCRRCLNKEISKHYQNIKYGKILIFWWMRARYIFVITFAGKTTYTLHFLHYFYVLFACQNIQLIRVACCCWANSYNFIKGQSLIPRIFWCCVWRRIADDFQRFAPLTTASAEIE